MKSPRRITDRQMESFIGKLLRAGVLTAAVIVAAGGVFYLARHGGGTPGYHAFTGEPAYLKRVGAILKAAMSLRSEGVIQLGLIVLIAVPILRVAVSIIGYALERDWLYVLVTALVLAILTFALVGGAA